MSLPSEINSAMMGGGGYQISRSVRLRNSASAYFNRTPASNGNRQIMTFSFWMKRGLLTYSANYLNLFSAYPGTSANDTIAFSPSSDSLRLYLNGSTSADLITTQVFRDPSAWYHIVVGIDTTQATASNRIKVYVNGSQITTFSTATYPTQNYNTYWNSTSYAAAIGANLNGPQGYFDGYLTEINFIDGQQLTPSSFGQTNAVTGIWQPIKYAGTYGTNGFYLNFSDNSASAAAAIGKDYSGNGNNWTPNNISVTAGATYDSMLDVPTPYADGGNGRGNYCVLNPLATNTIGVATLTNGNLTFSIPNTFTAIGSMSATSGKFYWEAIATSNPVGVGLKQVNVLDRYSNTIYYMGSSLSASGEKYVNGTASAYGASWTTGDVIGVAVDMDGGTVTFYKNNASQGSIALSTASISEFVPSFVSGAGVTFAGSANFGQRPFTYTPPAGFLALNTQNLPTPTIRNGANYMAATLWTGNGTSQAINNAVNGVSFQPDMAWVKDRSSARSHVLIDAVRGTGLTLFPNETTADQSNTDRITSFNSNGFSVGTGLGTNANTETYVGWQWNAGGSTVTNTSGSITSTVSAGATQGFSVVTYTGNSTSGATVGHGLGVAPSMVIVKARGTPNSIARSWFVYHSSLGGTKFIYLDLTSAAQTGSTVWNNTNPSSTVFTLGNENSVNMSANNYVAYCFSEVAGYSKFGSYTGNGSTDGPFVYLGFRPRYILIKETDAANQWVILDTSRDTYNYTRNELQANASSAEIVNRNVDIISNGFKFREGAAGSGVNANGGTYIYAAFAENPFKYSLAR